MSIARIREALAAGPTPGPWSVETVPTSCGICHKVGPFPGKRPDDPPRHACLYADYPSQGNPADDELKANAAFIAACNPAAIRELLAERDALKADAERYRYLKREAMTMNAEVLDECDSSDHIIYVMSVDTKVKRIPVVYHGASIPDLDALIDAEIASEGRR